MKVIIACDSDGFELKEFLKEQLEKDGAQVLDATVQPAADCVDAANLVCQGILSGEAEYGVVVDAYGTGSFMTAVKHKYIVAAQVADEHSAFMTRGHNNTSVITLGAQISGKAQALGMVRCFLRSKYDGGRHQIRVDMLNKMC